MIFIFHTDHDLQSLRLLNLECIDFHVEIAEGIVAYESYLKDLDHQQDFISPEKLEVRILDILREIDRQLVSRRGEMEGATMVTTDSLNGVYALSRWLSDSHKHLLNSEQGPCMDLGQPIYVINLTRWRPDLASEEEQVVDLIHI